MPDRDYVVVSPTDCIMKLLVQVLELDARDVDRRRLDNPLQYDTVLDVKGVPISVSSLLANAPEDLKRRFDGGPGLSSVLMPNTYHHFHSPVDSIIRYAEARVVKGITEFGNFFFGGSLNILFSARSTMHSDRHPRSHR